MLLVGKLTISMVMFNSFFSHSFKAAKRLAAVVAPDGAGDQKGAILAVLDQLGRRRRSSRIRATGDMSMD